MWEEAYSQAKADLSLCFFFGSVGSRVVSRSLLRPRSAEMQMIQDSRAKLVWVPLVKARRSVSGLAVSTFAQT